MVNDLVRMSMVIKKAEEKVESQKAPQELVGFVVEIGDEILEERANHNKPKPSPPESGITLRAAERKYGILHSTLSRWIGKGYLPILLRTRNELYVEEVKLRDLIERYKSSPGQGKNTIKQQFNTS